MTDPTRPWRNLEVSEQEHQTFKNRVVIPLVRPVRLAAHRSKLYLKLLGYGKEALSRGNPVLALRFFERAHNLKPGTRTFGPLAWAYALKGDLVKAKEMALQSHELNQEHAGPMNDYGCFLLQEGQIALAMEWFSKAKKAAFNPRPEMAYINTARAYLCLRSYRQALREFKLALDLAPGHKDLLEIITRLKNKLRSFS